MNGEPGERQFHNAHSFKVTTNVQSHRNMIQDVRVNLDCAKKKKFRQTSFGQFLDLEVHRHSAVLIHCVLFQQVNKGQSGRVLV